MAVFENLYNNRITASFEQVLTHLENKVLQLLPDLENDKSEFSKNWKLTKAAFKATNEGLTFVFHLTGIDKTTNAIAVAVFSVVTPLTAWFESTDALTGGVLARRQILDLQSKDAPSKLAELSFRVGQLTEGFLTARDFGFFTSSTFDRVAGVSQSVMGYAYLTGGVISLADSKSMPNVLSAEWISTKDGRQKLETIGNILKGLIGMNVFSVNQTTKLALNGSVALLKLVKAFNDVPAPSSLPADPRLGAKVD